MKKIARRLDLPYPIEKVWDTALSVLDHAGWEITHQNKASYGMEIHVTMDMITWTETFYLNLIKTGGNSTRVVLGRIAWLSPLTGGFLVSTSSSFYSNWNPPSKM